MENAIEVKSVGVRYRRVASRKSGVSISDPRSWIPRSEWFWALDDISFELKPGRVLGVLGANGAGKSTLLRVITGVLPPDRGRVNAAGSVNALFNGRPGMFNQLSGRDNIMLQGALLGMSQREIDDRFDEIVEFAGLEESIDAPLRTYSLGMGARLAFAVASAREPDILILDEVLSAGDKQFREKSEKRIREMIEKARAILFVSHNPRQVESICDEVLWLEDGRVRAFGPTSDVLPEYQSSS